MSRGEEKARRKLWQFSLRELVALTVVVALGIGYWQERTGRQRAIERLEKLISSPVVVVQQSDPMTRYALTSNVSFLGLVHLPNKYEPVRSPQLVAKLIRAETLEVINEIQVSATFSPDLQSYSFAGTFDQTAATPFTLQPGIYLINVEWLESQKPATSKFRGFASGFTVLQAVDSRKGDK